MALALSNHWPSRKDYVPRAAISQQPIQLSHHQSQCHPPQEHQLARIVADVKLTLNSKHALRQQQAMQRLCMSSPAGCFSLRVLSATPSTSTAAGNGPRSAAQTVLMRGLAVMRGCFTPRMPCFSVLAALSTCKHHAMHKQHTHPVSVQWFHACDHAKCSKWMGSHKPHHSSCHVVQTRCKA